MLTREQFETIHGPGSDGLFILVTDLQEQVGRLTAQVRDLQEQDGGLTAQVKDLQELVVVLAAQVKDL